MEKSRLHRPSQDSLDRNLSIIHMSCIETVYFLSNTYSLYFFSFLEFIKPATSRTANGDIDDAELHVLSWFHSQSECSLLGSQSIRMFSPGFTVNQNVLSWVHSQPDKFMRSLEGVKDLAKTRLQLALQEALTQLPSITKHFDQTFEANTIYAHNDAVASLAAHSPPRGTLCNEVQISSS